MVSNSPGYLDPRIHSYDDIDILQISLLSQLAMTAAFVVKTVYIVMTFLVIVILWRKKSRDLVMICIAMVPFFLALGFTSYSYLRFGLLLTFNENQAWADWWEESTEFIMIASIKRTG